MSVYPTIKGMTSFGWGRRTCLGQDLTEDELLVACGSLCWAFNLTFKVDQDGRKIDIPTLKSNSLLIVKPDPFQMAFIPRSNEKIMTIIEQWKAAEAKDAGERQAFVRSRQPVPSEALAP